MKRVYLILTLFMTSFFLLSSNVSADTINLEVNSSNLDLINDTFFRVRELAIELSEKENKDYIISYAINYGKEVYLVYLADALNLNLNDSKTYVRLTHTNYKKYYYVVDSDYLFHQDGGSTYNSIFISGLSSGTLQLSYNLFLDTSLDNLYYITPGTDFNINYNGTSYFITENSRVPSLYELYLGQSQVQDPKSEIVTNFYVLIIDKIKLLTNYIATDYIILSALVIFIFVAVIGLVRRLK